MARSLDSNIYGIDENAFASRVSTDALNPSGAKEDYWGSTFDQSAEAKGNASDQGEAKKIKGIQSDSRAKTSGNHGAQD